MKLKDTGPGVVLKGNARKQAINEFVRWVERRGGTLQEALKTDEAPLTLSAWLDVTPEPDRQTLLRRLNEARPRRRWRNRPDMTQFPVRA
jgi:hypothetical protein